MCTHFPGVEDAVCLLLAKATQRFTGSTGKAGAAGGRLGRDEIVRCPLAPKRRCDWSV